MGETTFQTWVGGRPESGSGINLEISLLPTNNTEIKMQKAYFRDNVAPIKLNTVNGKLIAKAVFVKTNLEKPDIISHSDSSKEVGNQPPKLKEKSPFKIAANECVISYLDGEKTKYFKIESIKEKEPLLYK